jgi:hypothetical protein
VRGEDPKLASIFHIRAKASTYLRLTQFTDRFTLIAMLLPEPRVVPTPSIELDSATAPATVDLVWCDAERPFVGFQCEAALGFGAGGFFVVNVEEADVLLTDRDTDGDSDGVRLVLRTLGTGPV